MTEDFSKRLLQTAVSAYDVPAAGLIAGLGIAALVLNRLRK